MKIVNHRLSEDLETIEVYPISDVHIGDKHSDEKMFLKFLDFVLEKENRFIILNGDLANVALRNSKSNVYADIKSPSEQLDFLEKHLLKVKDRILAITEGNHEVRISNEVDISLTEQLAKTLGLRDIYDPIEVFLKIGFGKPITSKHPRIFTFYISHGDYISGGATLGGALSRMEKSTIAYEGIDIFVAGHVHKKLAGKNSTRVFDTKHNRVIVKERLFVVSSHWMNFGGYAARRNYVPGVKGATKILLNSVTGEFNGVV